MRPERVQRGALRVPVPARLLDQYVPLTTTGGRDDEGRKLAEVGDGRFGDDERDEADAWS
jgi:hypothetical protein